MATEPRNTCTDDACGAVFPTSVRLCPRCGAPGTLLPDSSAKAETHVERLHRLHYAARGDDPAPKAEEHPGRYLEMMSGDARRRWVGTIGYVAFFGLVAGVLYVLFTQFTGSVVLATCLVGFMVAYMSVMGWLASRNAQRRE